MVNTIKDQIKTEMRKDFSLVYMSKSEKTIITVFSLQKLFTKIAANIRQGKLFS